MPLAAPRAACILWLPDNPGQSSHFKIFHLITPAKSPWPCKVTYSQVAGRLAYGYTSGTIIQPTTKVSSDPEKLGLPQHPASKLDVQQAPLKESATQCCPGSQTCSSACCEALVSSDSLQDWPCCSHCCFLCESTFTPLSALVCFSRKQLVGYLCL